MPCCVKNRRVWMPKNCLSFSFLSYGLFMLALGSNVSSNPAPAQSTSLNANSKILENIYEQTKTGYHFRYETGDGKIREEHGVTNDLSGNPLPLYVRGYYSYTQDDDNIYNVYYEAGVNGYQEIANQTKDEFDSFIDKNVLLSAIG